MVDFYVMLERIKIFNPAKNFDNLKIGLLAKSKDLASLCNEVRSTTDLYSLICTDGFDDHRFLMESLHCSVQLALYMEPDKPSLVETKRQLCELLDECPTVSLYDFNHTSLSGQLSALTGDSFNSLDYHSVGNENKLSPSGIIIHRKTRLRFECPF